eukprot:TRINITY_DN11861_c0_g1_i1.p1 TRINITY_DN11861_c0_g1~~TRINITY_DN11861_c0_g1_i1.p1  ORF type:complete len:363 (+),score=80.75 TRINITY_DN11861_c0_g1_i1:544-1632(+)
MNIRVAAAILMQDLVVSWLRGDKGNEEFDPMAHLENHLQDHCVQKMFIIGQQLISQANQRVALFVLSIIEMMAKDVILFSCAADGDGGGLIPSAESDKQIDCIEQKAGSTKSRFIDWSSLEQVLSLCAEQQRQYIECTVRHATAHALELEAAQQARESHNLPLPTLRQVLAISLCVDVQLLLSGSLAMKFYTVPQPFVGALQAELTAMQPETTQLLFAYIWNHSQHLQASANDHERRLIGSTTVLDVQTAFGSELLALEKCILQPPPLLQSQLHMSLWRVPRSSTAGRWQSVQIANYISLLRCEVWGLTHPHKVFYSSRSSPIHLAEVLHLGALQILTLLPALLDISRGARKTSALKLLALT